MSFDSAVSEKGIRRHIATAILVANVVAMPVLAQRNPTQNQLSSPAEDAERIRRLTTSGVRVERGVVTAWFSSNAMTPEEMQGVVERLIRRKRLDLNPLSA